MLISELMKAIEERGTPDAWVARKIGLTPSEFWQKKSGYRGRKFSEQERAAMEAVIFPDSTPEGEPV